MNEQKNRSKDHSSFRLIQKNDWILFALIGVCLGIGLLLLPYLPDKMAPHFSSSGEPTRYEPKLFTIIIVPVIGIGMVLFFNLVQWATSKLDLNTEDMDEEQKAKEDAKHARIYVVLKLIALLLLLGPYFYIIHWNLMDVRAYYPIDIQLFVALLILNPFIKLKSVA